MDKVRWGIIGPGSIAHTFARDIQHTSNACLSAVCSRTAANARTFATAYGIDKIFSNVDEMLAGDDVDAVYIATPHTLHAEQTLAAIAAGKSVMCEKPFSVGAQECQRVIDAAEKSDVFVMEALWTYFLPAMIKAKAWADEGRIGRIVQVHSSFGYPMAFDIKSRVFAKELAGGCLLDMGIYPIAINQLFMQRAPDTINSIARFAANGVEDDLTMMFGYADSSSSLATSFRARLPNWTYVVGELGYIAIPDSFRARECFLFALDEQIDHFDDKRSGSGFEFEIEAASADILAGLRQSARMPLATSLALQQQMDAVKASIENA